MDAAYFSAIAALSGSVVGGLTSLAASWVSQSAQARISRLTSDKNRRQELYRGFIEEASRLYADALASDKAEIANLVTLYAMVSRMRILSSPPVIEAADDVVRLIISTYGEPTRTLQDLQKLIKSTHIDPLRHFSEVCRDDLRQTSGI
jgi:hypothetical protein